MYADVKLQDQDQHSEVKTKTKSLKIASQDVLKPRTPSVPIIGQCTMTPVPCFRIPLPPRHWKSAIKTWESTITSFIATRRWNHNSVIKQGDHSSQFYQDNPSFWDWSRKKHCQPLVYFCHFTNNNTQFIYNEYMMPHFWRTLNKPVVMIISRKHHTFLPFTCIPDAISSTKAAKSRKLYSIISRICFREHKNPDKFTKIIFPVGALPKAY